MSRSKQTAGTEGAAPARRRLLALLGAAAAGALVAACGKRGPLRMPEPAQPAAEEESE